PSRQLPSFPTRRSSDLSGTTVKLMLLVALPLGVVTVIGPVVAPAGTVAVMLVSEPTENDALVPLNETPVAPVKLLPVIVTDVPRSEEHTSELQSLAYLV